MRGPARERAPLVRELERKLDSVKRSASVATEAARQADHSRQDSRLAATIQVRDPFSNASLGVPVRPTGQTTGPNLQRRIDQVGGDEAIRQHANRSRVKETKENSFRVRTGINHGSSAAHAYEKHVDISDTELRDRLSKGLKHATRWTSDAAAVTANAVIWSSPITQQRRREIEDQLTPGGQSQFFAHAPLSLLFGADWRDHVDGLSGSRDPASSEIITQKTQWNDDGYATAGYRFQAGKWHLFTCFPRPEPPD
jgi:hypothetical protein